jgi:hypothetical protein
MKSAQLIIRFAEDGTETGSITYDTLDHRVLMDGALFPSELKLANDTVYAIRDLIGERNKGRENSEKKKLQASEQVKVVS